MMQQYYDYCQGSDRNVYYVLLLRIIIVSWFQTQVSVKLLDESVLDFIQ
jgi:hypothetical protein